jgi:hypothetical protein
MPSSQPPRKRLPVKSSLENLRKRAKQLARAENVHLTEAQHRLARDHGFENWARLAGHVESLRDRSEGWRREASENLPKAASAGDLATVARSSLQADSPYDLDPALARCSLRRRREIAPVVEHG